MIRIIENVVVDFPSTIKFAILSITGCQADSIFNLASSIKYYPKRSIFSSLFILASFPSFHLQYHPSKQSTCRDY